jgi:hypothetical protein
MAVYRRSIIWRLACSPVSYLWSGVGDIQLPGDTIDPQGATYKGAGALLSIPALKQLINGIADRVDFTVSGVTAETVRLALDDRQTIKGAVLRVGYILLDDDWQIIGKPVWEWKGAADILSIDRQSSDAGGQRTITLSVAATDTDRANPQLAWFTDANQRRRSSTDAIFDRVAGISAGSTRRFGPK